jgi:hypothetical protein
MFGGETVLWSPLPTIKASCIPTALLCAGGRAGHHRRELDEFDLQQLPYQLIQALTN